MHSRLFRKTSTNAAFLRIPSCCVVLDLVFLVDDVDVKEKRSLLAGVSILRLLVEAMNAVKEE